MKRGRMPGRAWTAQTGGLEQSRYIREAPPFTPQLGAKSSGGTTALPPAHTGSASLEHVWLATENLWRIRHTRPESPQPEGRAGREKSFWLICARALAPAYP